MKRQAVMGWCVVFLAATANAYWIQDVSLNVDHWAGFGDNECILAIDWNSTSSAYNTEFHLFGFRWGNEQKTVKDMLVSLEASGVLTVTYAYGGGFIGDIVYDQTAVDGDHHTAGTFFGWWWAGETHNGGLTWQDNSVDIGQKILHNGGIEGLNVDGSNWGSQSMSIPEPATMLMLGLGAIAVYSRKK